MRVAILGTNLPGRRWHDGPSGECTNVHVGIQVRKGPTDLVPADAVSAEWRLDVQVLADGDGGLDFRGPAVQGRRGERFVYLTWGDVGTDGAFAMFRRAKLMLNDVDRALVREAESSDAVLTATVDLTDDSGGPRCARLRPPALRWTVGHR